MATKKQKQELLDILKFTPCTYSISIYGYGGEAVMGTVNRETYEYFKENDIDVEEHVNDYDNELEIPDEHCFAGEGQWYDNDNICHVNGVEMSGECVIEVHDENGNLVWTSDLDPESLEKQNVSCSENGSYYVEEQPSGTVVFFGQNFEKGTFFVGDLNLKEPFSPSKFSFNYTNVDGWLVFDGLEYNGEELYSDDYSTTGKSTSFYLTLVGDEGDEVYTAPDTPPIYWPDESEYSAEFPVDIKPVYPGTYECRWSDGFGTSYGRLEWTGENWVEYEFKKQKVVNGIQMWKGLNWDTSDWKNCPVPKKSTSWPF